MTITIDYDLRGIFSKELGPEIIKLAALQFYQKFRSLSKKAILAYDPRKSSLKISKYLQEILPDYFVNHGLLTTPIFYWLVIEKKQPGIMITASHLPYKYNGLKFFLPDGSTWTPLIKKLPPLTQWSAKTDALKIIDSIYYQYFAKLNKLIEPKQLMTISLQKNIWTGVFKKFLPLINLQVKDKSDFLFKSDLDVDRIKFYYHRHEILPDIIFRRIALNSKYKKLAAPITMSYKIRKELEKYGKQVILTYTGHRYIKEAFLKHKIEFAFEPSGHFYFFKDLKTESPFLALGKYLKYADVDKDLDLQKNLEIVRKNFSLKRKINLEKLIRYLVTYLKPDNCQKFDGYLLMTNNFQLHLRLSRTENKLRLSAEGNKKLTQKYVKYIRQWLNRN